MIDHSKDALRWQLTGRILTPSAALRELVCIEADPPMFELEKAA